MQISIIGLDLIHPKLFAPILRSYGINIHSLIATDSEITRSFAVEHSCLRLESLDDLKALNPMLDGLLVASIFDRRLEVQPFLERGVPTLFCKQMAPGLAAARLLIESASAGQAPVMAGSTRRFAPAFRSMQEKAHRGDLGHIVTAYRFEPHSIEPGDWQDQAETSGGFIVNFGIHCVDSLCAVLGYDFRSVYCVGGRYLHENAASVDACTMIVQFARGAIGIAEVFGAQAPFMATQPMMRLHGTKGSVEAYIDEGFVKAYRGAPVYDPAQYAFCNGNEGMISEFVSMMRTRRQPVPSPDLLAVMEILDLARTSHEEGRVAFRC